MEVLVERVQRKAQFCAWRSEKYLRQVLANDLNGSRPAPLFLVGCQRSGTNMNIGVLDKSLHTWVYNEDDRAAFYNFRLKPAGVRRRLIAKARCPQVVFKAICDSQNVDRLLAQHPDAKVIWDFRRYQDVANSAVRKWGNHQLDLMRQAATNRDWPHFFFDRMTPERRQLIKDLYHEEMSAHTAAALFWYIRNDMFFEQGLDQRPEQVRLVKYEELVSEPVEHYTELFHFLGIEFDPDYVSEIFTTSVSKSEFPPIDAAVEKLCEEMLERLNGAMLERASR